MDELAEDWGVVAWKCYTQWGSEGRGFSLHEETGLKLIEKASAPGVKNICVRRGLPFGKRSYQHSLCSDIGIVAKMFPNMGFLVYHSGFVERQHRTLLEEHFRVTGRKSWYETIVGMQVNFDEILTHHNHKCPHQGRAMNGWTPYATFKDGLPRKENARMKPPRNAA